MRPRRWVLVFFCALAGFAALAYYGIRSVERSSNVERVLAERISPLIGGSFDIGRIRLGFFSAYLEDVRIEIPMEGLHFEIRDIKVGFSLRRLIRFRGDFGKSIGRIILLEPNVTLTLLNDLASDSSKVPSATEAVLAPLIEEFPVENLMVRNGAVFITDRKGQVLPFGSRLNGIIGENKTGLFFEMKGKLASRRKNLSLSGSLARTTGRHRLSVRIDNAKVDKPVDIGGLTIERGVLDGVCEVGFGDTISRDDIEVGGWLRIKDGSCEISALEDGIENVGLRVNLSGSSVSMDSLACSWNSVDIEGSGFWDISSRDSMWASLYGRNLDIGTLASSAPEFITENVLGRGWVQCRIMRRGTGAPVELGLEGGGVTVLGAPVTSLTGSGIVENGSARLDSFSVEAVNLRMKATGVGALVQGKPTYFFEANLECDSIPQIPRLAGDFTAKTSLQGTEEQISGEALIQGKSVFWNDVPFGSPVINVESDGKRLRFAASPENREYVLVSGDIVGIHEADPLIDAEVNVGAGTITALLSGVGTEIRDAIGVNGITSRVFSHRDSLRADIAISLSGTTVDGLVGISVREDRGHTGGMLWKVRESDLNLSDSAFSLVAHGSFRGDSVTVDTFTVFDNLGGSARFVGGVSPSMRLDLEARRLSLGGMNRWLLDGAIPVDAGHLSGGCRLAGPPDKLRGSADIHLRDCEIGGITSLETDAVLHIDGDEISVPPMIFRKSGQTIVSLDTLRYRADTLLARGSFDQVEVGSLLKNNLPEDLLLSGEVTGEFHTSPGKGFPVKVEATCPRLAVQSYALDSIATSLSVMSKGIKIDRFRALDTTFSVATASGYVPFEFLGNNMGQGDTVKAVLSVSGDLVASTGRNTDSPIAGTGQGTALFQVKGTDAGWVFEEGTVSMPKGRLTLNPFLQDPVENFSFSLQIDDSSEVDLLMKGVIDRKRVRAYTSQTVPDGYEPLELGPVKIGVLQVETPDRGINLHVPGFQEIGETGLVEFSGKNPFNAFTISGPIEKLKISGTWVLHDVEFTFPFIEEQLPWPLDPFPYISWELDLEIGRRVFYFWELRGKRRQLIRFCDLHVDRSSWLSVRGRDLDKTFRLEGLLKTFKGAVYFGKTFDRNVRAGVEFVPQYLNSEVGYDNFPVIWGKAETFSDTSRFDRITLKLQVIDPATGAISDRGRIALIPASKARLNREGPKNVLDSLPNFRFHLSSDFEEVAGETQQEFYQQAGLQFTSFESAGNLVSNFGEQYLHRYLFQQYERRLAKRLGLDVVAFESSFASNYFTYLYNREYDQIFNRWNLLANVGLTVGRYFFRDYLFLKARGEFIPTDSDVRPEYSVGLEFMPAQYFMMDLNYGFYMENRAFQNNPRVQMQFRLPIQGLRNSLDF